MKYNLQPLTGMAELAPTEQLVFERWKKVVQETYALYGFTPVETPVVERAEIMLAKAGEEASKQIYRLKKGDTELALRFDLTVPLARFVAGKQNELAFPFRRQAVGKVYRGEKAQKARFREFYQADADIIGRGNLDLKYDAEIISLIVATIEKLNLGKFQVQINNRKLVTGFLRSLKVMDENAVLHLLDSAEKIGEKKLKEELKILRLDTFECRKIWQFAQIQGQREEFVQALLRLDLDDPNFAAGIAEIETVAGALEALGAAPETYCFKTGIIRGLDYYTGTVFETKLTHAASLGSICGGGRYENLVGSFGKEKMPGVGMSIGLTRLFAQALELGLIQTKQKTISQVVVIPVGGEMAAALPIVAQFRQAGVATEVYLQEAALKKKLKYASDLGVPFTVMIGEAERERGKVTIKNMATGEQLELNVPSAMAWVLEQTTGDQR